MTWWPWPMHPSISQLHHSLGQAGEDHGWDWRWGKDLHHERPSDRGQLLDAPLSHWCQLSNVNRAVHIRFDVWDCRSLDTLSMNISGGHIIWHKAKSPRELVNCCVFSKGWFNYTCIYLSHSLSAFSCVSCCNLKIKQINIEFDRFPTWLIQSIFQNCLLYNILLYSSRWQYMSG